MNSSSPDNKKRVGTRRLTAFGRIERIHPLLMLLYVGLLGVTVLFVILVASYLQTRALHPMGARPFPRFFALSTVLLLLSSATLRPATRHYRKDRLDKTARALGLTMILGIGFVLAQLAGWRELLLNGYPLRSVAASSYVYLLSSLHAAHLLGGLLGLSYFYLRTRHAAADGVRTLVFIRNPYRRLQLRMLRFYWHYLDVLWLALFGLFLFVL